MLYLDNAATSLKKPLTVYASMIKNTLFLSSNSGRGGHRYSIKAAKKIYEASEAVASLFNIPSPEQIAYTPNATYALNLGILGMLTPNDHAIITQMEHNSVIRPVKKACNYTVITADKNGFASADSINDAIKENTKLIIMTHASNVCGTIEPIRRASEIAHSHNIPFMVDAAQTAGCIPIDVQRDGIDILAFSGHKGLMAPMGVGGIYVSDRISLMPVITGGTGSYSDSPEQPPYMPDLLQSGTLNTPALAAVKRAVDFIKKETVQAIGEHDRYLANMLIERLKNINGVTVYGVSGSKRTGTVAFNIKPYDSVYVSEILDKKYRICTRGGLHCAYPAHCALGTNKTGAVRASFGYFNTNNDVKRLADAVYAIASGK